LLIERPRDKLAWPDLIFVLFAMGINRGAELLIQGLVPYRVPFVELQNNRLVHASKAREETECHG